jgi:bacterial/archaeal transporter family-2 protein
MAWVSFLFALVSGAFITCQAGANTQLKKALGQPMPAVVVNYLLGLSAVLAYSLITGVSVPTPGTASKALWWSWTGGLLGIAYGLAAVFLGNKLGAATLTALVVTGQLICSVILDQFGWFGFDIHQAGWGRILARLVDGRGSSTHCKALAVQRGFIQAGLRANSPVKMLDLGL